MNRPRKLDDDEKARIIDRVRRGEYLSQIARGTGFNTAIIRATAQRAGLVILRCSDAESIANMKRGRKTQAERKAQPAKPVMTPVMSVEDHWKGMKAQFRW